MNLSLNLLELVLIKFKEGVHLPMYNKTQSNSDEKIGILVDANDNSTVITCGTSLKISDAKNHLVGIIDVASATIETKKGHDSIRGKLEINSFFVIKRRNIITIVTRIDDNEYCVESFDETTINN